MLQQINAILDQLVGLITGAPKNVETPEARAIRVERLAVVEREKTEALEEKLQVRQRYVKARDEVLEERRKQLKLYSDLGEDSPQMRRQKQVKQYIVWGVAIIVILVIVRSCF